MWAHCRDMAVPDELTYKVEQFRRTGRIVLSSEELFREASWFAVMMGQGIEPKDYNPLADTWSATENLAHLAQIKRAIQASSDQLAPHEAYIQKSLQPRVAARG
jgi:tryptophan halogenase